MVPPLPPEGVETILRECAEFFDFVKLHQKVKIQVLELFEKLRETWNNIVTSNNERIMVFLEDNEKLAMTAEISLKNSWKFLHGQGANVGETDILPLIRRRKTAA